jgi:5-methylcytosine-specific restriction endonuclease McrA
MELKKGSREYTLGFSQHDLNLIKALAIMTKKRVKPITIFSKSQDHKKNDLTKSPHWQRKRLEIMQRDNFTCQHCGDTESQLHVHHKVYLSGKKYHDYPDELLITLCSSCHKKQHGK